MPLRDLLDFSARRSESATATGTESAAQSRRRRIVVAGTLVLGTAILAGTLATSTDSALFYALGILGALTWIAGAVASGPLPMRRASGTAAPLATELAGALLLGVVLFGGFLAAKLLADHLPVLSGSVRGLLDGADAGPRGAVLAIALVNGLGEELLFRGALQSLFARRALLLTVAVYALVTVATLNTALVVAAVVMGTVLSAERRATGGVVAPIVTHLTWSTLMLLLLPR